MRRDLVSLSREHPSRRRPFLLRHCRGLRGRSPTTRHYSPVPRSGVRVNRRGEPTDTACRSGPRSSRISVKRRGEPDPDCVSGFTLPRPIGDSIRDRVGGFALSGSVSVDVHIDTDRPEPPVIDDIGGSYPAPVRVHARTGDQARRLPSARRSP
jgi:hypothetical protein